MSNPTVAATILAQLGGRRFLAMTGAKSLVGSATSLKFTLPRHGGLKINTVIVTLTAADDYTVEFCRWLPRTLELKTFAKVENVYCDNLRTVFEGETGLATSL